MSDVSDKFSSAVGFEVEYIAARTGVPSCELPEPVTMSAITPFSASIVQKCNYKPIPFPPYPTPCIPSVTDDTVGLSITPTDSPATTSGEIKIEPTGDCSYKLTGGFSINIPPYPEGCDACNYEVNVTDEDTEVKVEGVQLNCWQVGDAVYVVIEAEPDHIINGLISASTSVDDHTQYNDTPTVYVTIDFETSSLPVSLSDPTGHICHGFFSTNFNWITQTYIPSPSLSGPPEYSASIGGDSGASFDSSSSQTTTKGSIHFGGTDSQPSEFLLIVGDDDSSSDEMFFSSDGTGGQDAQEIYIAWTDYPTIELSDGESLGNHLTLDLKDGPLVHLSDKAENYIELDLTDDPTITVYDEVGNKGTTSIDGNSVNLADGKGSNTITIDVSVPSMLIDTEDTTELGDGDLHMSSADGSISIGADREDGKIIVGESKLSDGDIDLGSDPSITLAEKTGDAGQVITADGSGACSWQDPTGGSGASLPDGSEGDLFYYSGDGWTSLPIGGEGELLTSDGTDPSWTVANPSTGEMLYYDGGWGTVAAGGEGQTLQTDGSSIFWDTDPNGLPEGDEGDLFYYSGDGWGSLGIGNPGELLYSDGTDPNWTDMGPEAGSIGYYNGDSWNVVTGSDGDMLYCTDNDWNTFSGSDVADGDFIVKSSGTPSWTDLGLSAGELIFWNGSGWTTIDSGSDGDSLQTDGSSIYWASVDSPITDGSSEGDMLYWDGTSWSIIDVGSDGDVLMLSGSTPTWTTPSSC